MKGHLRERAPGRWAIVIEMHDPETGKRKRKWHSFKGTKREAQTETSRLISAISAGTYQPRSGLGNSWTAGSNTLSRRFHREPMNGMARLFGKTSIHFSALWS